MTDRGDDYLRVAKNVLRTRLNGFVITPNTWHAYLERTLAFW